MKFADHVSENNLTWGRRLSWNYIVILGSISIKDQLNLLTMWVKTI